MWPALIMAVAVTAVLVFSGGIVSLLRHVMPRNVRLILEMTLIASAVIVTDEALKAYTPEVSATLSVFVGLIITNCLVLGRAEAFALNNSVGASLLDGIGNGIGYGLLLLMVAAPRELLGAGSLLDKQLLVNVAQGGSFVGNKLMSLPASWFFIIGLFIWGLRSLRRQQIEPDESAEQGA
jgi:Na+-transporting NADH:ubiquinone oxidoreductase subunit D